VRHVQKVVCLYHCQMVETIAEKSEFWLVVATPSHVPTLHTKNADVGTVGQPHEICR
jgi:hypothetical protein